MGQSGSARINPGVFLFLGVIFLLNLVWILVADNGNDMLMDDGRYMYDALVSYQKLTRESLAAWHHALFNPSFKAPLIWWAGQFFVPMGVLTGSEKTGLLMMNLGLYVLNVYLIYRLTAIITRNALIAFTAALFFASSVSIAHHSTEFFREPLQILCIIYSLFLAVRSDEWKAERLIVHSLLIGCMAIMTKAALVAHVFFPMLYVFYRIFGKIRKEGLHWKSLLKSIAVLIPVGYAAAYYVANGGNILGFTEESIFFDDNPDSSWKEAWFWLKSFYYFHFGALSFDYGGWMRLTPLFVGLTSIFFLAGLRAKERRTRMIAAICIAQILLMLILYSVAQNRETRYVCDPFPFFVIPLSVGLMVIRWKPLIYLLIGLMVMNLAAFNVYRFTGWKPSEDVVYYDSLKHRLDYDALIGQMLSIPGHDNGSLVLAFTNTALNDSNTEFYRLRHGADVGQVWPLEWAVEAMSERVLAEYALEYEDIYLVAIEDPVSYEPLADRLKDFSFEYGWKNKQALLNTGKFDRHHSFNWENVAFTVWKYEANDG